MRERDGEWVGRGGFSDLSTHPPTNTHTHIPTIPTSLHNLSRILAATMIYLRKAVTNNAWGKSLSGQPKVWAGSKETKAFRAKVADLHQQLRLLRQIHRQDAEVCLSVPPFLSLPSLPRSLPLSDSLSLSLTRSLSLRRWPRELSASRPSRTRWRFSRTSPTLISFVPCGCSFRGRMPATWAGPRASGRGW